MDKTFSMILLIIRIFFAGQCSIVIHKSNDEEYVLGTPYNYTCACKQTYPRIDQVNWIISGQEHVQIAITELPGYLWDIQSTIRWQTSNLDEVPVTCKIVKDTGDLHWTAAITHTPHFITWNASDACIPQLTVSPSEVSPKSSTTLRCSITVAACFDYMIAIKYQKKPLHSGIWKDAYIRFSDRTEDFRTLDYGYTLNGRTKQYPPVEEYDLDIVTTELGDSGLWRCIYWSINGKSESIPLPFEVTGQCSIALLKSGGTEYVLGTSYNYTCACEETYPRIDTVKWMAGGHKWTENAITQLRGFVWDVQSTITWQASNSSEIPVTCTIAQSSGNVQWESSATYKPEFVINGGSNSSGDVFTSMLLHSFVLVIACLLHY